MTKRTPPLKGYSPGAMARRARGMHGSLANQLDAIRASLEAGLTLAALAAPGYREAAGDRHE
jgi:hypothetical protein